MPATLDDVVRAVNAMEVTFLGENHSDPVAHFLELEILRRTETDRQALSMEMFESDIQFVLDEYLAGQITEAHLLDSGRAWSNYERDYQPLVDYARDQNIPVIAANVPRRYVNLVSREGEAALLALGQQARQFLPPLPYAEASTGYADKFLTLMRESRSGGNSPDARHDPDATESSAEEEAELARTLRAQSLWDASMAYSIAEFINENDGYRVIHINGSFHTAGGMGIPDHLERYRPGTTAMVVTMIPSESFPDFESETMAQEGDFVIVTDPSLLP